MGGESKHVPWVGVNHLALITSDMDATVRFWHGVLDAPLVATLATPSFRHYFFKFGPTTTVAFFEYLDADGPRATDHVVKPAGVFDPRAGFFDHLSLDLPDEAALASLQARLRDAGCEVTDVVDHHIVRSIYFTDPNGISLEASHWVNLDTSVVPALDDTEFFADADPVPAVRELMAGGLQHTPATHLVSGVTAS